MIRTAQVLAADPGASVQDAGRPGALAYGVSRGGAADVLALHEGAALLGQPTTYAVLEVSLGGLALQVRAPVRLALTGADRVMTINGAPCPTYTTATAPADAVITLGPARRGCYSLLHLDGGLDTPAVLGSRSVHLTAKLGQQVLAGDTIQLGPPVAGADGLGLDVTDRLSGGVIRLVRSYQSDLFGTAALERLTQTRFTRDPRGNRMGLRLASDGPGFAMEGGLTALSDIIIPGDIQITGDGAPYVLLADCQTTGGYPRMATVLPCDMPRVVQAPPGSVLRFQFVTLQDAVLAQRGFARALANLSGAVAPRVRGPNDLGNLLRHQLISGAITGQED